MILVTGMLLTQSVVIADSLGHALGANGYLNNMPLYYKKHVRNKRRHCNYCKQRPMQCKPAKAIKPVKKTHTLAKLHHNHMKLAQAINQLPANSKTAYKK